MTEKIVVNQRPSPLLADPRIIYDIGEFRRTVPVNLRHSITRSLARCSRGSTATEYTIIAASIAMAIIAALELIGTDLNTSLNSLASSL
ncbi:MAG: Flp family type IVb pilin [Alphaproteobacteria bacterium]|nr:Flp family type IVb pilin [Alphaproteobacteria bacterium]